jgi:hypothetical protein
MRAPKKQLGWGTLYCDVARTGSDEDVRTRMHEEWGRVATVSSLLSGMVYSPFLNPPSGISTACPVVLCCSVVFSVPVYVTLTLSASMPFDPL